MANWISEVPTPSRIALAWQASEDKKDRHRWAVAWVERVGGHLRLTYFRGKEFEAMNNGRSAQQAEGLGYKGYPGFALSVPIHETGVLGALMRRLPPRTRSDFIEYKAHFSLAKEAEISDMALLARTEAKLPSDGFSLVDLLEVDEVSRDLLLEVAGRRYYPPFDGAIGDPIGIIEEDDNKFDAGAVMFTAGGRKIGNINRLQAPAFRRWLKTGAKITGSLERINGSPDRPRAFIFVRIRNSSSRKAA